MNDPDEVKMMLEKCDTLIEHLKQFLNQFYEKQGYHNRSADRL